MGAIISDGDVYGDNDDDCDDHDGDYRDDDDDDNAVISDVKICMSKPPDAPDAPRTPTIERWIDDIDDDDNVDSDDADDDDKSTHRVEEEVRMSRASAIARGVEVVPIGRVAWEKELLLSLIKHRDKEKIKVSRQIQRVF